jgi:hypothetical protein
MASMVRRQVALAEILERALPPGVRRRVYSVGLVSKKWASVVGEELARRSEPESLSGAVLTIRVTDPAWGRMILKLQGRIVPALNLALGTELVQRINFVTRESLRGQMEGKVAASPRFSREDQLPENVMRALKAISNEELREMVKRSASLYLRAREERKRK